MNLGNQLLLRVLATLLCAMVCVQVCPVYAWETQADDLDRVVDIAELISAPREYIDGVELVRIRGTISVVAGMQGSQVVNPSDKSFCVEDDTAGIWVRVKQAVDEEMLEDDSVLEKLRSGVYAEIVGRLAPGGFAPVVMPHQIRILGPGKLKEPILPDLKDFFRGAHIMRRVAVGGVVQSVTDDSPGWLVRVETGAGYFLLGLPDVNQFTPEKLMDAEIHVVGVAGASRNWRSQFTGPRVMIAEVSDVKIVRAPAEDPFDAERVRFEELDGFNLGGRSLHRRCLEGAVTYYDNERTIYLANDGVGIRLELNQMAEEEINLGDWVVASGFIDSTRYIRGLRGVSVRSTGTRVEIPPAETTVREIIDDHFRVPTWKQVVTKTYDGRVVTLSGEVLGFDASTDLTNSRIEVACDGSTFTASLHGPMEELLPGSIVELTGIAAITYAQPESTSVLAAPQRVELLLRSTGDISIVQQPSWWTVQRITGVLALSLLVAGLAVAWAVTLNRRVARQTEQLAVEMRSRRDASIEFQAAIRERTHLAANIHDTVLQTLAGIGCQLEACALSNQQNQTELYLKTASRMVQGGQEDLRSVVSALHCLPQDDQTFGESVRGVVNRLQRTGSLPVGTTESRDGGDLSRLGRKAGDKPRIVVDCAQDLPKLADFIAGNLLLIIQEATRNAIRHARANSIEISVEPTGNGAGIQILIADDGCGFDRQTCPRTSEGHFGLETMKGRAERIGGVLTVESESGMGTRVTATASLRSFDEAIT